MFVGQNEVVAHLKERRQYPAPIDVTPSRNTEAESAATANPRAVGNDPGPRYCLFNNLRILGVRMIDAVPEFVNKKYRVDQLPNQVTRVEVKSEFFPITQHLNGPGRSLALVGYLRRVHLHGEADTIRRERVQDFIESFRKNLPGLLVLLFISGQPRITFLPYIVSAASCHYT